MEINMPANGVEARSRQLATLSGIAFEMGTSEKFSTLITSRKRRFIARCFAKKKC
jgi:Zn-dependent M32 family carboxypeptidase